MIATEMVAARMLACRTAPYLAPALFGLHLQEVKGDFYMRVSPSGRCDYCREKLELADAWNVRNLSAILVHEVWHVLRRHFVREQAVLTGVVVPKIEGELAVIFADLHVLWNIAADLAINDGMRVNGFTLPEWGQFAGLYGWPEFQTAEFYFEKLLHASEVEMDKLGDLLKRCGLTPDEFASRMSRAADEDPPKLERRMRERATAEGLRDYSTKHPGKIPQDQDRWAGEQLVPSKVRWQDELRHGLVSLLNRGEGEYSWRRVNRRKQDDLLFPGIATQLPVVAIVEDTSGSMGTPELQIARSETAAVLRTLRSPVTVLCCDAAIAGGVQRIYNIKELKLVGGGGTDMTLGIAEAAKIKPKPQVVICLTDGHTGWPEKPPANCKFITVLVGTGAGPGFGKVVRVT